MPGCFNRGADFTQDSIAGYLLDDNESDGKPELLVQALTGEGTGSFALKAAGVLSALNLELHAAMKRR
ncbi:MAG: hypothetical protein JW832_18500 [Deltaproteobacteria bacterium]|nr:hypothetical protein [Deltaproteobacteria bacterium]